MSRPRASFGQALKDVALRLAKEAERYVGAKDTTPCAGCNHLRSEHCGCGTSCLAPGDPADKGKGMYRSCECGGFTPKPEEN